MIKHWQSMQDYKYFLNESKAHFDFSERNRLYTQLWDAWQKLRLFDPDKAMDFLLPFYSTTGRPAKNQSQILKSFILFILLYSIGLARLSITLWVGRLKHHRVLAALIGCTLLCSDCALCNIKPFYAFLARFSPSCSIIGRICLKQSSSFLEYIRCKVLII